MLFLAHNLATTPHNRHYPYLQLIRSDSHRSRHGCKKPSSSRAQLPLCNPGWRLLMPNVLFRITNLHMILLRPAIRFVLRKPIQRYLHLSSHARQPPYAPATHPHLAPPSYNGTLGHHPAHHLPLAPPGQPLQENGAESHLSNTYSATRHLDAPIY